MNVLITIAPCWSDIDSSVDTGRDVIFFGDGSLITRNTAQERDLGQFSEHNNLHTVAVAVTNAATQDVPIQAQQILSDISSSTISADDCGSGGIDLVSDVLLTSGSSSVLLRSRSSDVLLRSRSSDVLFTSGSSDVPFTSGSSEAIDSNSHIDITSNFNSSRSSMALRSSEMSQLRRRKDELNVRL